MQKVLIYNQTIKQHKVFEFSNPGENTEILGIVLGSGREHFDLKIDAVHTAPLTTCRTDFRIILQDKSSCTLKGVIRIAKNTHQVDAFLNIKSLLLSETASVVTEPSLEIEANDVKASHSASVGQVDSQQVLYLNSRGLTRRQAETLILEGFLTEIVEKIKDARMKKDIEEKIRIFLS